MKTVLVCGGAGYIGSHTSVELLNAGYDVIVVDTLKNSKREALRRVEKITGKSFRFYQEDVCDKDAMERIFSENKIDSIIHFAGYKAVGESVEKPIKYYRNNLVSTMVLLECMEKYNVPIIIFSSSATVYDASREMPVDESSPFGPINPYGRTKYFGELIIDDFMAVHPDMAGIMLRYFNPVGAHESGILGEDTPDKPANLMPYIVKVASGEYPHLNVFGNDYPTPDGTGVRDYIHVVDLAQGHIAALKYAEEHKGAEHINLGTGTGYSVLDIVNAFEKASGVKIPYVITDRRPGDAAAVYSNPTRAKELLGWQAKYNIEDMCRSSYNWVCKNPHGYPND